MPRSGFQRAPLSANRLKLGVFGTNIEGGLAATTVDRRPLTWAQTARVARIADEAGIELQLPVARWKPMTATTGLQGTNFDSLSWAAGLAATTRSTRLFSTVHAPTVHPIVAAKQLTTIDHISGGRGGLNVVCGWYGAEFEMFGAEMLGHEDRYAYATEWMEIIRGLWTSEGEFDYDGRFFQIKQAWHQPKPLEVPFPPVINAGMSAAGQRFAARFSDIAFTAAGAPPTWEYQRDAARAHFADLRRLALEEFSRRPEIWTAVTVVCRPTQRDADAHLRRCFTENPDPEILASIAGTSGLEGMEGVPRARIERFEQQLLAGFGSILLAGTAERITEQLVELADIGLDGAALNFIDYEDDLRQMIAEVLPLLEEAGLREPPGGRAVPDNINLREGQGA